MSRFFPRVPYAEDQPLSHTILITHVLHRGFQAGAVLTLAARLGMLSYKSFQVGIGPAFSAGWPVLQRSVGGGSIAGMPIIAGALWVRMRGREQIEWQDRSWRLLENAGQVAVDDWSLVGTVAALAYTAVRRPKGTPLGWNMVVGRAALGNVAGVIGYMIWTNGVRRKS